MAETAPKDGIPPPEANEQPDEGWNQGVNTKTQKGEKRLEKVKDDKAKKKGGTKNEAKIFWSDFFELRKWSY